MNLLELIQNRYSVRNYLSKSVEKEKIEYVLECARLAPSANNFQPWHFYVATSDEGRKAVLDAYPREWVKSAPMFIVVCADHDQSWKRAENPLDANYGAKDYADVDASIVSEHICLATSAIGLGTCWICNFDAKIISASLALSDNMEVIAIFSIGYIDTAKSVVPEKKRKVLGDITTWI